MIGFQAASRLRTQVTRARLAHRLLHQRRRRSFAALSDGPSDVSASSYSSLFSSINSSSNGNQSSFLDNNAASKQRELEMAIGKAADTLRNDYPNMLITCPSYDIYDPDIELVDPSGVTLHGLTNYKRTFGILRAIIQFLYSTEMSGLTFRLLYDYATKSIRVTWHAVLIPKPIYGGYARRVHIDGISVYEIDRETGLICKHRLEQACMNNIPVQYPQGIWDALHTELVEPHGIPVGIPGGGYCRISSDLSLNQMTVFQTVASRSSNVSDGEADGNALGKDHEDSLEQLERKNTSRAKFGLKPLSMEEFQELQQQVQVQDRQQRLKLVQQQQQQSVSYPSDAKTGFPGMKMDNLLDKIFAGVIPDKCESNDDCERPLVCCDFIFKKVCCASGVPVGFNAAMRPAMVPVPVRATPEYPENF